MSHEERVAPIAIVKVETTRMDGWSDSWTSPPIMGLQPGSVLAGTGGQQGLVPVARKELVEAVIAQLENLISELKFACR